MNNEIIIRSKKEEDLEKVLKVVNSFVKNSFAAYSDEYYPSSIVEEWSRKAKVFLVLEKGNKVIGFGFVASYKPHKSCNHVGVLTYFILTEYTGKGLGTRLFNELILEGRKLGITNYLAHISSKNEQSFNFHKKHGFQTVGRFKDICVKLGESTDMVWVQKQFNVTAT
jgi:phosphinothricin acetyltransferase